MKRGVVVRQSIADARELENIIGILFKNKSVLLAALTHSSYANERGSVFDDNERLEYLGDGVLDQAVKYHLYRTCKSNPGRLTALHSALVNNRALAKIGEKLKIERYMRFGTPDAQSLLGNEHALQRIRACAVEALIGAIRIDRGIGMAELFIEQFVLLELGKIKDADVRNPKQMLHERAQEQYRWLPVYEVLAGSGSDQSQVVVAVYLGNRPVGQGTGVSRDEAEQRAARSALREVFNIDLAIWNDF